MIDWIELADYNALQKKQLALDELIFKRHHTNRTATLPQRQFSFLVELAEFANEVRFFKYWSYKPPSGRAVLLEEYVDCLHFLISLSLDLKVDFKKHVINVNVNHDVQTLVFKMIDEFNILHQQFNLDHYLSLWMSFHQLAMLFNFNRREIISAYDHKYQINLKRQADAY